MAGEPRVLVSNIMMLNERERFDQRLRADGFDPLWAIDHQPYGQFLDEVQCLSFAGDVDAWLAGDDQISRAVLEAFRPRLKGIAKWGTGVDSIDTAAAAELGVPVLNSPAAFADAVAEVAIGLMLMVRRHLGTIDRAIRAGEWPKPKGRELRGATLGMIGLGAIGRRIAELGRAFGMEIVHHDPFVDGSIEPLDLAERSDVVCLACALTPDNRNLVDAAFLSRMKPDSILVNVARGPIVDEPALVAALRDGTIAGAGLDVFIDEPLPQSSPLRSFDNVVLSSHNANNGVGAVEYVHDNTLRNLKRLFAD